MHAPCIPSITPTQLPLSYQQRFQETNPVKSTSSSYAIFNRDDQKGFKYCSDPLNFADAQCTRQGFDAGRVNPPINFIDSQMIRKGDADPAIYPLLNMNRTQIVPSRNHNDFYTCRPPFMDDGRFLTYFNSSNELTEAMRKAHGFQSENEFRTFLQRHGQEILDGEKQYQLNTNSCGMSNNACSQGYADMLKYNGTNKFWGDFMNECTGSGK
jgi:hypothetical protein